MRRFDRGLWRSRWAALGAAVAVALGAGGVIRYAAADVSADEDLTLQPMPTCRLFDTKPGIDHVGSRNLPLAAAETFTFGVEGMCGVPAEAEAVELILTILSTTSSTTALTMWPADENRPARPSMTGAVTRKVGTYAVELSAAGQISIHNVKGKVHVAVDVIGVYANHHHDDRYYTKDEVDDIVTDLELTPGPPGEPGPPGPSGVGGANTGFAATTIDDNANDVGTFISLVVGTDGLPIVSYYDATAQALKVAHCNDIACTGGDEAITTVDDPANDVGRFTSIAIGADDLPVISYRDTTALALKVAHCNDIACTGGDETITTVDDPANAVGSYSSITVGTDGLPIISYRDATALALKVAHCNDIACTGGDETITTVDDPANNVAEYTSITIGADGLPIISYRDFTAQALKVAHCNDVACTGSNETITTVDDPTDAVGSYSSITIGVDGLPIISYRDLGSQQTLKVAHCNDVACTGNNETITTVDNPANFVGEYTSITIGADSLPIISYFDFSAGALRVAHCNDIACTGTDEAIITVDDPANSVGSHSSITIGVDGLPVIGYYDSSAQALKILHCSNTLCTPFVRRR